MITCQYDPATRRILEAGSDDTVYGWNHENIIEPEVKVENDPDFQITYGVPDDGTAPF